jgi:heptosyltransferase-1
MNAGLLQSNPRLDEVIIWPRRRWQHLRKSGQYWQWIGEFRRLLKTLRGQQFDWVLDTQGLLKSGFWAFLSGGKKRIGLGSREGSQWLMTQVLNRKTTDRRIGGEYLKLVRALGIEPVHFEMDIAVSEQDYQKAMLLLKTAGIGGPFMVICPFTTRPQKHWFAERWAELAGILAQSHHLQVVMLGGPTDSEGAEAIAALAPGLINLVGKTSLMQCAALIQTARLLIGVDTGLTHLGIAMKIPTLALFGSTRPYLDTGLKHAKVLWEGLSCTPCRRRPSCGGDFTCMKLHTVGKVASEAAALLAHSAGCETKILAV